MKLFWMVSSFLGKDDTAFPGILIGSLIISLQNGKPWFSFRSLMNMKTAYKLRVLPLTILKKKSKPKKQGYMFCFHFVPTMIYKNKQALN